MGPLAGLKVVEIGGIGAGPFCGMMLADLGADVVRLDRLTAGGFPVEMPAEKDILARGRRSVALDLKSPAGVALALEMIGAADVAFEGFRPGVVERLGLGPDVCIARNPRLVYGRMTGWGQTGPLASTAGHDINYIALSGALYMIGREGGKPTPPLSLVADFGGGGMLLALGIVAAVLEARQSGIGQVVDAAMFEGASLLMSGVRMMMAMGLWREERGVNMADTGSHFYEVYETADGKYLAVGAIEPAFYRELLERLDLDAADFAAQMNPSAWPALKARIAARVLERTRDEWAAVFAGSDACVTPVLTPSEAAMHPHAIARRSFVDVGGMTQPAPAPRFSRTPAVVQRPPPAPGEGGGNVLHEWNIDSARVIAARAAGALA